MKIIDRIYGRFEIKEPVLLDLIKSAPIQRLKKINQFGIPDKYYHLKNYSRYEHSIGVMLLLRRFGASLEEQIAGLLHDVSHSAFSHVIDWVYDNGVKEDHQDKEHKNFAANHEIAAIAKKYNYSLDNFFDYHDFSLLEKDIPDLCADRVDYSLREFSPSVAKSCYLNLLNNGGKLVFRNKKSAEVFAYNFLKRQKEHWGGFEAVTRYTLLSKALKVAIEKNIISREDFLSYDDYIIIKLIKSKNPEITEILKILSQKKLKQTKKTQINHKKFRYVDPQFINKNGCVCRLTSFDSSFKKILEKAKKENDKGIRVPNYFN